MDVSIAIDRRAARGHMPDTEKPIRADSDDVETPIAHGAYPNAPEYGSDAVVDLLKALEFRYVFVVPGSSFAGLQDSYVNYGGNKTPKTILCTHETTAVSMAHGYAMATNGPALVTLHDLVGLMNGAMAIYNAYAARLPVVMLGGSGPADVRLRGSIDYAHSANVQGELVRPFVKWDDEATTVEGVLESIAQGYKIATMRPMGPVYLSVDIGIQEGKLERPVQIPDVRQSRFRAPPPPAAPASAVERVADLLIGAEMPAVICGRVGTDPAITPPLVELVEALGAAFHEDRNCASFPSVHPQNLSGDGAILSESDAILCIDSLDIAAAVGGRTRKGQSQEAKPCAVIDLSLNEFAIRSWARLGWRSMPTTEQLLADPVEGLKQLLAAVKARLAKDSSRNGAIAARKAIFVQRKNALRAKQRAMVEKRWNETPVSPHRLISELWNVVRAKPWLITLRSHRSWPEGIWEFTGGGQYVGHTGGGGLGHGPGAMVGAALAARDRGQFPLAVIGDGDFMMTSGALWTAVHYRIPLLVVIYNNVSYYNDEEAQKTIAEERGRPRENAWIGTACRDPEVDHASVARGYGCWAEGPIVDPDDIAPALKRAVAQVEAGKVAVLDVRTSPK
jgi:acetolactate synthase-1/2/3 large subunit